MEGQTVQHQQHDNRTLRLQQPLQRRLSVYSTGAGLRGGAGGGGEEIDW